MKIQITFPKICLTSAPKKLFHTATRQIKKIKTMTFWKEEERLKEKEKLILSRQTWDGSADLGFNLQSGNTEDTQMNLAIKTKTDSGRLILMRRLDEETGNSN